MAIGALLKLTTFPIDFESGGWKGLQNILTMSEKQ